MGRQVRPGAGALLDLALLAVACSDGTRETGMPTVTGPVIGGKGVSLINPDLSSVGYVREEYFFEGSASAYKPVGELGADGAWRVEESGTAPFKSRLVVWKPADPTGFDGTVFVEWLNVTVGFDNPPDLLMAHNQFVRTGAIWVGVSAQKVGIEGGPGRDVESFGLAPLKQQDPARYGSLAHPGDAFSYDIFTQAGRIVRGAAIGVEPLGGYGVERVIAIGESQSAFRLTTYANAIQPRVGIYDWILLHSRGGTAAPFGDQILGVANPGIPDGVWIRDDLKVSVLTFETECDLLSLDFVLARQPDGDNFRLWEVAGTSHQDSYTASTAALTDFGDGKAELVVLDPAKASGGVLNCSEPINAGAQHAVLIAALAHLERWVRDRTVPPTGARIETTGGGADATIVRNDLGIARGGIRTPIVDVQLATNDGEENAGGAVCRVFGRTRPFDDATLAKLYPNRPEDYVAAFERAADQTVEAGFWLKPEAENFKAAARQITFR